MNDFRRVVCLLFLAAWCACGDGASTGTSDAASTGTSDAAIDAGGLPVFADASMPDAAMSCGDFGQDDGCAACLADECCTAGAACEASDACSMLVACTRDCAASDDDCRVACVGEHPSGRGPYNTIVLCMGDRCLDACPFPTP